MCKPLVWEEMDTKSLAELMEIAIDSCKQVADRNFYTFRMNQWINHHSSPPTCCIAGAVVITHFPERIKELACPSGAVDVSWLHAINHLRMGLVNAAIVQQNAIYKSWEEIDAAQDRIAQKRLLELCGEHDEATRQLLYSPPFMEEILKILKEANV